MLDCYDRAGIPITNIYEWERLRAELGDVSGAVDGFGQVVSDADPGL